MSQVRTTGREKPRPASMYLGPQLLGCPGFEEQSLPRMLRGPERQGPAREMQRTPVGCWAPSAKPSQSWVDGGPGRKGESVCVCHLHPEQGHRRGRRIAAAGQGPSPIEACSKGTMSPGQGGRVHSSLGVLFSCSQQPCARPPAPVHTCGHAVSPHPRDSPESESVSHSVLSDSLQPRGLYVAC